MSRIMYAIIALVLVSACKNGRRETTAQVVQRRMKDDRTLVLTYRFHTGEKWVYDSTELDNKVIPHDSIQVSFSPGTPEENSLRIP